MQQKKKLILITIFIIAYIIINLIVASPVQAVEQTISTDINGIDDEKYPGVKEMILDVQKSHPNWQFKVLYTGLDWEEVIMYEYMGHKGSPKNLVPVSEKCAGDWICLACGENHYYDSGKWRCASEAAIQYMMDARNSINNSDIFQFMELTYQECSYESLKQMAAGTFLDNENYINTILTAGKKYNVSPYYIVALAIQEQGITGSSTISGTYAGYEGYYNIFNINASGNGEGTIISRALSYAKNNEWDSLEASIDGGVNKIATSYIARGQNTLYFQKFDVENSDGKMYWHQYQQNILAAQNEGVTIRKTFEKINALESSYTFVIPLYENTPVDYQKRPSTTKTINTLITDLVKLNVNESINLRGEPAGKVTGKLYAEEIVTRLESSEQKHNGTYWDKVMKANGTIGYVARETYSDEAEYKLYLVPILESIEDTPNEEIPEGSEQHPEANPNPGLEDIPDQDEQEKPEENKDLISMSNEKIKIDAENNTITIIPGTTIEEIINLASKELTAIDINGKEIEKTAVPGTGVKINEKYTVVMLGDANGDGEVNSGDTLAIKQHIKEVKTITNTAFSKSADINGDGEINSGDSLIAKQHIKEVKLISLK